MEFPDKIDPEEVFQTDTGNEADFEIAFTTLVATAVLSTPIDSNTYNLMKGSVVLLTALTLIRKMAIENEHKPPDAVLHRTIYLIQIITYLAMTHLLLQLGYLLSDTITESIPPIAYTAGVTPVFVLAIFGMHRRIFGDLGLYLGILSYNVSGAARENPIIPDAWDDWLVEQAGIFVSTSASQDIPKTIRWLEHYPEDDSKGPRKSLLFLALAAYGTLWAIFTFVFGTGFLTLLFLVMLIFLQYPVAFWYSRYGLARYTSDRGGKVDLVSITITLLAIHYIMIPGYTSI